MIRDASERCVVIPKGRGPHAEEKQEDAAGYAAAKATLPNLTSNMGTF